jgi:hypothetical protein
MTTHKVENSTPLTIRQMVVLFADPEFKLGTQLSVCAGQALGVRD